MHLQFLLTTLAMLIITEGPEEDTVTCSWWKKKTETNFWRLASHSDISFCISLNTFSILSSSNSSPSDYLRLPPLAMTSKMVLTPVAHLRRYWSLCNVFRQRGIDKYATNLWMHCNTCTTTFKMTELHSSLLTTVHVTLSKVINIVNNFFSFSFYNCTKCWHTHTHTHTYTHTPTFW